MEPTVVSSDDKLYAALSYWGSFIAGFVPALIIFLIKKEESHYIKKHALQSLVLNLVAFVLIAVVLGILSIIIGMLTFGIGSFLIAIVQLFAVLGVAVYFGILGFQTFNGENPNIPYLTEQLHGQLNP